MRFSALWLFIFSCFFLLPTFSPVKAQCASGFVWQSCYIQCPTGLVDGGSCDDPYGSRGTCIATCPPYTYPTPPYPAPAQSYETPAYDYPTPSYSSPYSTPPYGTPYATPAYGTPYSTPPYGYPYPTPAYGTPSSSQINVNIISPTPTPTISARIIAQNRSNQVLGEKVASDEATPTPEIKSDIENQDEKKKLWQDVHISRTAIIAAITVITSGIGYASYLLYKYYFQD